MVVGILARDSGTIYLSSVLVQQAIYQEGNNISDNGCWHISQGKWDCLAKINLSITDN